jgi:hypothetical protein
LKKLRDCPRFRSRCLKSERSRSAKLASGEIHGPAR